MAIKVGQPFLRTAAAPIDETLVLTKAEMLTIDDDKMPENYFAVCVDDGKLYVYDKQATKDPVTGKYRLANSSEGTTDYNQLENKPKIEGRVLEGDKTFSNLGIETLSVQEIEKILYL